MAQYKDLDFPLNVYALCLLLQEGKVDYLHYALINEQESVKTTSIFKAQQRATDLLLSHLPPPPCHILEVGIGLGTTALQLANLGYTITGISPDSNQITIARQLVGDNVTLDCITLENFSPTKNEKYDIVLFQESSQYINSHTLFAKTHSLLTEKGIVLITDEVGLQLTEKHQSFVLPSLDKLLMEASKCGFNLDEKIDLSAQAKPTVDYLLWVIEKHRTSLLEKLNLSEQTLVDLLTSLQEYKQKYNDGHYGYVFLKFIKGKPLSIKTTSKDFKIKDMTKHFFMNILRINK